MQKKLIAIAIAAALAPAAAAADTSNINVYGRLNVSLDSQTEVTGQSAGLAVNTNSSRFGIKGSEDLGDGYSAIFQVETNVNLTGTGRGGNGNTVANSASDNYGAFGGQVRDTWLGLSTPLGTIQAGRLPMENHWVYESNLFADQVGDLGNFNSPVGGRANGEILYTTPTFSGFKANMQLYPATSVNPSATVGITPGAAHGTNPSYGFELDYSANGIKVSLNHLNRNTGPGVTGELEYKPWVVSGSYTTGSYHVSAQYMRDQRNGNGLTAERGIYNIGGSYMVTSNGKIKAQYSKANNATGSTTNGLTAGANTGAIMYALGYDYALSKRTSLMFAYAKTKNDAGAVYTVGGNGHNNQQLAPTAGDDPRGLGVSLTHNF